MSEPQIIPLQNQWRLVVELDCPHLEIELLDEGWSETFVAQLFPRAFAAKLALAAYRAGYAAGGMEAI